MARRFSNVRTWTGSVRIVGALATSLVVAFPLLTPPFARAQDPAEKLPSGESILDKYVEVTGGAAAYRKLTNRKLTGTMNIPSQGLTMKLTSYGASANKSYTLIESEAFGQIEFGTDGKVAWQIHPVMGGPRIMEDAERDGAMREATFNADLEWRSIYAKVECVGMENVGETPCYKVQITPNGENAKPETAWYAKDTSLLVKRDSIAESPMGEIPTSLLFDDYKKVDGVLFSHRQTVTQMGSEINFTTDSLAHNVEIPADRFDLPEGVKQLLAEAEKAKSGGPKDADKKPDDTEKHEKPDDPK
ncbi:MAG: hypothetical protein HOP29_14400 [Phycisphaerales bacterium]|nr:hypothetical protein [Phycisphaerales bacterium]